MLLFPETLPAVDSRILTEKYRPATVDAFVGLEDVKDALADTLADPAPCSWLFVGPTGVGKTTLAIALASELKAQLHHIPSQGCNMDAIARVRHACSYAPAPGFRYHLVLVDEADEMTPAAQLALLSQLDGTRKLPDTFWVFTANTIDGLEARFRTRSETIPFSKHGIAEDAAALLSRVWDAEAPAGAKAPNFANIVKLQLNSVRGSLQELQRLLKIARTRARRAA